MVRAGPNHLTTPSPSWISRYLMTECQSTHFCFQMRILDRVSTQLTTLHKVLLDDLFKLATTVYTEVGQFLYWLHCSCSFSLASSLYTHLCSGWNFLRLHSSSSSHTAVLKFPIVTKMFCLSSVNCNSAHPPGH